MTNVICIVCPKGCHLSVDEENGYAVTGFGCERGREYGKKELVNPTRVITSTVKVKGGIHPRCPVKTSSDIPKGLIKDAMKLLNSVELEAPVMWEMWWSRISAVPGVDFIASRNM